MKISNDPLGLKKYLNAATGVQLIFYTTMTMRLLVRKSCQAGESLFNTDDKVIQTLRNTVIHLSVVILIFIIVKLSFKGDLGDYYLDSYVSLFILIT
jgi:hypothetical protein